jgi:hypothetical protein
MAKNNEKKSDLLGEPYGTASNRLRKMILFDLAKRLEMDVCFRCGGRIESLENFSIEHKEAWLNSDDPKKKFFDLDNIAFSHMGCNSSAADRSFTKNPRPGARIVDKEDTAWCSGCKRELDKKEFSKNRHLWSGLQSRCKECMRKYYKKRRHHPTEG